MPAAPQPSPPCGGELERGVPSLAASGRSKARTSPLPKGEVDALQARRVRGYGVSGEVTPLTRTFGPTSPHGRGEGNGAPLHREPPPQSSPASQERRRTVQPDAAAHQVQPPSRCRPRRPCEPCGSTWDKSPPMPAAPQPSPPLWGRAGEGGTVAGRLATTRKCGPSFTSPKGRGRRRSRRVRGYGVS